MALENVVQNQSGILPVRPVSFFINSGELGSTYINGESCERQLGHTTYYPAIPVEGLQDGERD